MDERILKKLRKSEICVLNEITRICKKNGLKYFLIGGSLLGAIRHEGFIPWDDDLDIAMPREDYDSFLKIAREELNDRFILDDISTNDKYKLIFAKVRLKNSILQERITSDSYVGNMGIWVDIFPFDYTKHNKDFFIKLKWLRVKELKAIYIRKSEDSLVTKKPIITFLSFFYKWCSMKQINAKILKLVSSENSRKKKCKYYINYGSQYGVMRQTHCINKVLPLKMAKFEGAKYPVPNDSDYVLRNIYGNNYMELPPVEKRITHNPKRIRFEDGEEVIFDE